MEIPQIIMMSGLVATVAMFFAYGGAWCYDARTWYLSGQTAYNEGLLSVYSVQGKMPEEFPGGYFDYPPPWLVWVYTAYSIKQSFSLTLDQWLYLIRLPVLLFTLANAFLLHFWIREKRGEMEAALAVFAYTVFPGFTNTVFGPLIGTFDAIPVFFTILSFILFERRKMNWSAASLGIGAAFKYYPLLLLPVFLIFLKEKRAAIRFAGLSVAPVVLVSIPPLLYDTDAYIKAHLFYANWVGFTSIYRVVYYALGWELNLWFGKTIPAGVDLGLLPLISLISLLILGLVLCSAYLTVLKKKISLLDSLVVVFCGLLGFWKYANHNYSLWASPFVLALAFTKPEMRIAAGVWLFSVFLMSLPYVFLIPENVELLFAMLVPISSIGLYLAIMAKAWSK